VREFVTNTAAAVEEQTMVTRGMAQEMGQATDAVSLVSNSISSISEEVSGAAASVKQGQTALAQLIK
jgi:methyl-accepting chemotaxis protein